MTEAAITITCKSGLGDDDTGRAICDGYKRALGSIYAKMHVDAGHG